MTETEWLASSDLKSMLECLRSRFIGRKFRLFAVACCRRVERYFEDDCCIRAVELAERYADGEADVEVLRLSVREVEELTDEIPSARVARNAADIDFGGTVAGDSASAFHSADATSEEAAELCLDFDEEPLRRPNAFDFERIEQCRLLRDLIGNPFCHISLSSAQRTTTIASLARAAYDERQMPSGELEPDRLAVLADALEEAGASAELTDHLRAPGPHVRGCWAVDLILGLT